MGGKERRGGKGRSQHSDGLPNDKVILIKPGVVGHHKLGMVPMVQGEEDISSIAVCCPVS